MLALESYHKMVSELPSSESHRVAASDDLEVSAYLEIARQRGGQESRPQPTPRSQQESILVVDFGSQYVQLIARRVREAGVYSVLVPPQVELEQLRTLQPRGLILSGGPASVYEHNSPSCDPGLFELGIPILGICYGMHIACRLLGAEVHSSTAREYGRASLDIAQTEPWRRERALQHATALREGFSHLGYPETRSATPIVPLLLKEAQAAVEMEGRLRSAGVLARAIRPPTVPAGTSRIRFNVMATHEDADLQRVLHTVASTS